MCALSPETRKAFQKDSNELIIGFKETHAINGVFVDLPRHTKQSVHTFVVCGHCSLELGSVLNRNLEILSRPSKLQQMIAKIKYLLN